MEVMAQFVSEGNNSAPGSVYYSMMRKGLGFAALLWLCIAAGAMASGRDIRVKVAGDLGSVEVWVSPGINRLTSQSDEIWDSLQVKANAVVRGGELVALDPAAPVEYTVSLRHSTTQWGIAKWHRRLRLSDWTHWLLTPKAWTMTTPFQLQVDIPKGGAAVLPFQLLSFSPGLFHYKAYPVLPDHGGLSIFGSVEVRQFRLMGKFMTAAVVGQETELNDRLFDWIELVCSAAARVHGAAPGDDSHIIVIPVPFLREVVPWAHVRRGGGSHVIAYVNRGASNEALLEDWTLFHELTHLYHPYLNGQGRWVSEGLASYYQNLYRAEAGVVTPDFAYGRLMAGFERGRKENEQNGNRLVTAGGRMRTYWTGAAMALDADSRLRELTQGELSLARAIGKFAVSHLPASVTWNPRDYIRALDQEVGVDVLQPLYDEYVRDRYFPSPDVSEERIEEIFLIN